MLSVARLRVYKSSTVYIYLGIARTTNNFQNKNSMHIILNYNLEKYNGIHIQLRYTLNSTHDIHIDRIYYIHKRLIFYYRNIVYIISLQTQL